jgi:hypothetical protein
VIAPIFFGLPSAAELHDAPHRAILAALDANLVLAVRALRAAHPGLHGYDTPTEPLPALAEAVLACALCLHDVLASYDDLAAHLARLDCGDSPPDGHCCAGADDDMPF